MNGDHHRQSNNGGNAPQPPPGFGLTLGDLQRRSEALEQGASSGEQAASQAAELQRLQQRQQTFLQQDWQQGSSLETIDDKELSSIFQLALDEDPRDLPQQQQSQPAAPLPRAPIPRPMPAPMPVPVPVPMPQHAMAHPPGFAAPPPQQQQMMPPPGVGYPRGFPGMAPELVPEPYTFHMFSGANSVRIRDTKRMKGAEIFNIIRFQRAAGQSDDTYSDDYYFLKYRERRQKIALGLMQSPGEEEEEEEKEQKTVSAASRPANLLQEMMKMHVEGVAAISHSVDLDASAPLPELPGVQHAPKEFEVIRGKAAESWHKTTNVLGKTVKSNLKTPKSLINFAELQHGDGQDDTQVFNRPEWKVRRLSADVADVILEIEDIHRLLRAKIKSLPQGEHYSQSVNQASQSVLDDLERSQVRLCDKLGTLLGFSSIAEGEVKLNDMQLRGVIWMNKGRRLLCRAAPCLLPMHHEALMNAVARLMVYFVCMSPDGAESDDAAEREKAEVDLFCAKSLASELTTLSLAAITQCLHIFVNAQPPEALRAVIATPGGAELVRGILVTGQKMAEAVGAKEDEAALWSSEFAAFIASAEEGIKAAQAREEST